MQTSFESTEALAAIRRRAGARTFVAEVVEPATLREPAAVPAPSDTIAEIESMLGRSMAGQLSRDGGRARGATAVACASRDKRLHIGGAGGAVHGDPVIMFLNL